MTSPSTIQPKFLSKGNELGVVAVGFSGGQSKPGVATAPTALIAAGLLTQLSTELHYTIHHDPTIFPPPSLLPSSSAADEQKDVNANDPPIRNMLNPRTVSTVTHQLADQVYAHASQGRMVLTLGGDHSIAIGTVAGVGRAYRERFAARAGKEAGVVNGNGHAGVNGEGNGEDGEVAVVWVDAHADINTPEISGSGNIHGMPLAWLGGLAQRDDGAKEEEEVFGWLDEDGGEAKRKGKGVLNLKKLVYIGLRDVDRGEKEILRREGIKAFSMHDVDKYGIGHVMSLALAYIGPNTPIHLSFDVDALDPQWAPSTGTPVRGGLTLREGDYIAECIHETGSLVAMDLVEVNPSLETKGAEETVRAGVSLVRCALGDTLL